MPIQIHNNSKKIFISVTDLAGEMSFGTGGPAAAGNRLAAGQRIHEIYQRQQKSKIEDYQREVSVEYRYQIHDYTFIVQGRMDGFYEKDGYLVVEEIKSVILPLEHFDQLTQQSYPHYFKQLKIYCYLWEKIKQASVKGFLIFINLVDGLEKRIQIQFDPEQTESYIEQRLNVLFEHFQAIEKWNLQRQSTGKALQFPYPQIREFQDQLNWDLEQAFLNQTDILISAPAGIGKTAAALYTSLRFGLNNKRFLFYVTSKTTQQQIVQQTIKLLSHQENVFLRAITIQAREKICPQDIYFCHPDFCSLLQKHSEKLQDGKIYQQLLEKGNITPTDVQEIAAQHQVCPFELSLDLSLMVDVVISDYNYVFDPQVYLKRFFLNSKYKHFLLVIDEAHNLYSRGRDYYSPVLGWNDVQSVLFKSQELKAPIFKKLASIYKKMDFIFRKLAVTSNFDTCNQSEIIVKPEKKQFSDLKDALGEAMLEYFIYKKLNQIVEPEDPFDDFFYLFTRFENILSIDGDEFTVIYDTSSENSCLKIVCKDPARQLKKRIDGFYSTIAMSATFEPLEFYRNVLGFSEKASLRSYPSAFPSQNRKVIVLPEISTRYRDRSRAYEPIAEIILRVAALKPGNYFAFFPSFYFLEQVAVHLNSSDLQVIQQDRYMNERARVKLVDQLKEVGQNRLVLAIQGGIFAEGVDYPGSMLIGAFIVGPALPAFTFEQELMKQYYQQHYQKGFEYAYLYPGMNRVIQSAGRVIRSHQDCGIIVLIGQRFKTSFYNSVFPHYWYKKSPSELISRNPELEINEFWDSIK